MSKANNLNTVLNQLLSDFKVVLADSERLLQATTKEGAEEMGVLHADFVEQLRVAKERLKTAEKVALDKAEGGIAAAEDYIRTNPWQALLLASGIAALIGYLAGRAGSRSG